MRYKIFLRYFHAIAFYTITFHIIALFIAYPHKSHLPYVLIPLPFTCVLDCGINFAITHIYLFKIQHNGARFTYEHTYM